MRAALPMSPHPAPTPAAGLASRSVPTHHGSTRRLPLVMAAAALLLQAALLAWEHQHGGIRTHHLLRSATLPGVSNAWGLLVLPALAGWTGWRLQMRLAHGARPAWLLLTMGLPLVLGLVVSSAFMAGREDLSTTVFMGVLLAAVLLPVARADCLLGWVLGMLLHFGALIPLLAGSVVLALSALVHQALLPLLRWALRQLLRGMRRQPPR